MPREELTKAKEIKRIQEKNPESNPTSGGPKRTSEPNNTEHLETQKIVIIVRA